MGISTVCLFCDMIMILYLSSPICTYLGYVEEINIINRYTTVCQLSTVYFGIKDELYVRK